MRPANALEGRICTTRAVTPAGLLAQAELVRKSIAEHFGCGLDGDDKRADHERGVDTLVEGLRRLFERPAKIAGHLADQGHDPLPGLVAEWQRRKALEQDAETDDDIETAADFTFEMDRPICFAKPRSLAGLKAQAVCLRQELRAWGKSGLGSELDCILDHFFDAAGALQDGLAPVTGDKPSPLRSLYARWRTAKAAYLALPLDDDATDHDPAYARIRESEVAAMACEPKTMEDLALQILFTDDDGDMSANTDQETLAARAYVLAGIDPPSPTESGNH